MHIRNYIVFFLIYQVLGNDVITLNRSNHAVLRGEITDASVSKFLFNLQNLDDDNIYIYISSPGGSVLDGLKVIDQIEFLSNSGKQVSCIADVAMSMGFVILQACPTRLITGSSVLMQHQMSFSVDGPIRNVNSRVKFVESLEQNLDFMQANRLNMSVTDFSNTISHDWWLYGEKILKYNAADKKVYVKCDKELLENVVIEKVPGIFGEYKSVYSECPTIRGPLSTEFGNNMTSSKKIDFLISY